MIRVLKNSRLTEKVLESISYNLDRMDFYDGFMYQTWDGTIYVGTTHKGLKKLNAARNDLENVDKHRCSVWLYVPNPGRDNFMLGHMIRVLKNSNAARDGLELVDKKCYKKKNSCYVYGWLYVPNPGRGQFMLGHIIKVLKNSMLPEMF